MKTKKLSSNINLFVSLTVIILFVSGCNPTKNSSKANPNIAYYTCSMHPSVRVQEPGSCPICGMDLVPVHKKETVSLTQSSNFFPSTNSFQNRSLNPTQRIEKNTTDLFYISPTRLQAIGIRTDAIRKQKLERILQAPGIVTVNEASLRDINVKVAGGYILELKANYIGKMVKRGEVLASILSEGWVEAQRQYISAYRNWRRSENMMPNANPIVLEQQFNRFRQRLRVWDLSEQQIKDLEEFALKISEVDLRTGKGLKGTFDLLSPISGVIVEKSAVENMRFEAGQSLLRLADLSQIWLEAEFPEDQSPYIATGQEFEITFPSLPQFKTKTKLSFIYPQLNPNTRRLKARFVLPNPGMKLLPGMYANVSSRLEFGEKLALPFDAVIPTGTGFIVFLDYGNGHLQPRYVKLGEKLGSNYEVLDGLKEGDRVITSANFLIDSESRIQGALKSWGDNSSANSNSNSSQPQSGLNHQH